MFTNNGIEPPAFNWREAETSSGNPLSINSFPDMLSMMILLIFGISVLNKAEAASASGESSPFKHEITAPAPK